jgi:hypothetical protein
MKASIKKSIGDKTIVAYSDDFRLQVGAGELRYLYQTMSLFYKLSISTIKDEVAIKLSNGALLP